MKMVFLKSLVKALICLSVTLILSAVSYADLLVVNGAVLNDTPCIFSVTSNNAPLTQNLGPCSTGTSAGGTVSGTGMAAFGTLGVTLTESGTGTAQIQADWTDVLNVGGGSGTGSAVELAFFYRLPGTLTYSINGFGGEVQYRISTKFVDFDSGVNLIDNVQDLIFSSNNDVVPIASILQSVPIATTVGSRIRVFGSFGIQMITNVSTATGDFLDPVSMYIEAIDPSTGALMSDVTITGDSGAAYSVVAPSSVPEPAYGFLLATVVLAVVVRKRHTRLPG